MKLLNKRELELWVFYRITEKSCCANCKVLRDRKCQKGNNSLKALQFCSKRDNVPLSVYGSTCEDWR